MSKHKRRTKPAVTKERQAASEGYVYVSGSRIIRGWDCVFVEGSREGSEGEGTILRQYIPSPTGSVHPGQTALYTGTWRGRG